MSRAQAIAIIFPLSFAFPAAIAGQPCDQLAVTPTPSPGPNGTFLNAVAALNQDNLWAFGLYRFPGAPAGTDELPLALRWTGLQWQQVDLPDLPTPVNGPNAELNDAQAFPDGVVWAVGSATTPQTIQEPQTLAFRYDGQTWEMIPSPAATPEQSNAAFVAMGGVASDDFWAVGDRAGFLAAHWNGSSWTTHPVPPGAFEFQTLRSVSPIASDDVWAAGNTGANAAQPWVVHWDGSQWQTPIPQPDMSLYSALTDIKAFAGDDIWLSVQSDTGAGPRFLHWNGAAWEDFAAPPFHLGKFAGDDPDSFYSAGHNSIAHWNGSSWSVLDAAEQFPFAAFNDAVMLADGSVRAVGRTTAGPEAETLAVSLDPCGPAPSPDLDGDGAITSADLNLVLADFGCTQGCNADATGDAAVDSADLNAILAAFAQPAP